MGTTSSAPAKAPANKAKAQAPSLAPESQVSPPASPQQQQQSQPKYQEGSPFKQLARAQTFNGRGVHGAGTKTNGVVTPKGVDWQPAAPAPPAPARDPSVPLGLMRRSWTDVADPKFLRRHGHGYHSPGAHGVERLMNDAADAMLYRRHFNFTSQRRTVSLKGVVDFVELTRRQTGEGVEAAAPAAAAAAETVVVVDPFSTGVIVAAEA
eukprot:CAMPEP_0118862812 /NCGR_PEP_ID=MMETSP1163-20130328/7899_1 /TAXON_ID=124430 /ORGANISM="Phaeomonas parva, Strain CCMP2877" /LENGTH=208 /DNA_ID=CAMNT_0006796753 /DNA_START=170 /DNA_END=792 /DNA_ORIENTATION=+